MLGIFKGMGITLRHVFRKTINFQYPDEKRNDLADRFRGELKLRAAMDGSETAASRVTTEKMPPCMSACPSNMKIREYVGLVSMGAFEEAIKVIKEDNPLPLVCGRVCPHPCEAACRRGDKDKPVAINPIKRFAADYDFKLHLEGKGFRPKPEAKKDKKVAVIGAGPAGLTCSYYLALKGYQVTIFEKLPVAGGFLAVGIPDYRLPQDILKAEIDQILGLGVDLKLNTAVEDLDALFTQGFDAVFIGVGAHKPMKLEIEGEDELEGVIPGEEFLRDVVLGKKTKMGKKVAVVGGGNTAVDCARVSLREGAKEAYILYRRTKAEMPAHHIEIEDAEEEDVKLELLVAPIRIIGKNKKVVGVECQRMKLGEKDKSGRRRPVPIDGETFVLEVDTVMSAISRTPEIDWLDGSSVEIHPRWGSINADYQTGETSRPGVFAAGDVSLGASIAIEAIGGGKRAAISIDAYLEGRDIKEAHRRAGIQALVKPQYMADERQVGAKLEPKERLSSYIEVELGLTEEQALLEGKRCLSCETQTCIGCKICEDNCPTGAITVTAAQNGGPRKIEAWDLRIGQCIFCGICVEMCPTRTLYHTKKYELAETRVSKFDKRLDYLLRDESMIEKEGWSKPHKHVPSTPLLYADRPRKKTNEGWEWSDDKEAVEAGKEKVES